MSDGQTKMDLFNEVVDLKKALSYVKNALDTKISNPIPFLTLDEHKVTLEMNSELKAANQTQTKRINELEHKYWELAEAKKRQEKDMT